MQSRKLLLLVALSVSCGSKGPIIDPTPVPAAPAIACRADVSLVSHLGQPQPSTSFDTPSPRDGQPPTSVTCTPVSGSQFPNGTTVVTCEAIDSLARKGSCNFSVVVTPVPRLERTRFLTFGDSITEGKLRMSFAPHDIFTVPVGIYNEPGGGTYPELLHAKLIARYTDQTVTVITDGFGGETAGQSKLRLKDDLPRFNPEVVLILDGVNELLEPGSGTNIPAVITSIVDSLRVMIRDTKSRGARAFVATLTPMNPASRPAEAVNAQPELNRRIRSLAIEEGATLVDLAAAVPLTLIGADGLHPRPEGYAAIADEWFKAIVATLEVKTVTTLYTPSPR